MKAYSSKIATWARSLTLINMQTNLIDIQIFIDMQITLIDLINMQIIFIDLINMQIILIGLNNMQII
jgi:hypothetical protein